MSKRRLLDILCMLSREKEIFIQLHVGYFILFKLFTTMYPTGVKSESIGCWNFVGIFYTLVTSQLTRTFA
ncbi:hypothetical protein ALC53_09276 [Atta colombica]|uniref:Uncharacterized protein n=1 Tax=Atta colombica TaxID=520822 RepID=A0A195B7F9_9HYME|nr:hypothetical protein ALC53_09276 [Atta colombica]